MKTFESWSCKTMVLALVVGLTASALAEEWKLEPLGEPGALKLEPTFKIIPKLIDAVPKRPEGIVLVDAKRSCSVFVEMKRPSRALALELRKLADEVAWHLSQMCGQEIPLVDKRPADGSPYVELTALDVPSQTAVLRIEGDHVLIAGDGPGIGHAATYFLETLGVRYLWPGKTGKVIPKTKRIVFPKIDLEAAPTFDLVRRLWVANPRDSLSTKTVFPALKMDQEAFCRRCAECEQDRPGNRNFYVWHGFHDIRVCRSDSKCSLQDRHNGGHYFYGYYAKYHERHPDWFALQPDGTRVNKSSRPRLCLSNEGLIKEVIRDRIEYIKAHPDEASYTLCLPDGGRDTACMCENCRRLDPVNAPKIEFQYFHPWPVKEPYVSLTDRMLWFCNRVAEGVLKTCPGVKFKMNVYADYVRPPVKVRPHPSLVLYNVEGHVTDVRTVNRAVETTAVFANFGLEQVWRPNILYGFSAQVPLNYGRILYDDVTLFAANGIRGVSIDGCSAEFALKGFHFYLLGRALFNYDNLSYEGQLNDYCACFGKGSPQVRLYLNTLEEVYRRAAERATQSLGLLEDYPVDRLAAILDEAQALTMDDLDACSRVAFLQKGVVIAREELKLFGAWRSGDKHALDAARLAYLDFVRKFAMEDPIALYPLQLGFYGPYLTGAPYRPPKGTAATVRAVEAEDLIEKPPEAKGPRKRGN